MQHQDYLMENGIWKIRVELKDGSVIVNPNSPSYDVMIAYTKDGQQYVEKQFSKMEYDSLDEIIQEVFCSFVEQTDIGDSFFVAAHSLHLRVVGHALKGKKVVLTFFEDRFDYLKIPQISELLIKAAYIITDSENTTNTIEDNLPDTKLNITDIPPYDTRMDFGISQQLKVQNILIPIDGLDREVYRRTIHEVAEYLSINDLARVHIFTRNAQWGYDENIRKELADILVEYGYDERWVYEETDTDEESEKVEQRFFVDVCVDERTISKCINEQRVILDLRGVVDVFLYITAISKGVPRISFSEDQFLTDSKNGLTIDDFNQIGRSLAYYLDSLENWNEALVACYEAGKNYTTDILLDKWRKVLGIVE